MGAARRSDSAVLPARSGWPAARLDQAHEANHPDAGLALQRRPYGDGLHAEMLRSRGRGYFERNKIRLVRSSIFDLDLSLELKCLMPDRPLWSDEDQNQRLAELSAKTNEPIKDHPLRRDVRFLGILLGRVLVEQEGEAFFQVVERLRRLAMQHREQSERPASKGSDSMDEAWEIIAALPLSQAYRLAKAFAIYFELTNLAETNHRKRRRRAARLHADQSVVEGSFRGTLRRLQEAGKSSAEVIDTLGKIKIIPVFTAHPTEVTRHTVLNKRRRIANCLEAA